MLEMRTDGSTKMSAIQCLIIFYCRFGCRRTAFNYEIPSEDSSMRTVTVGPLYLITVNLIRSRTSAWLCRRFWFMVKESERRIDFSAIYIRKMSLSVLQPIASIYSGDVFSKLRMRCPAHMYHPWCLILPNDCSIQERNDKRDFIRRPSTVSLYRPYSIFSQGVSSYFIHGLYISLRAVIQ